MDPRTVPALAAALALCSILACASTPRATLAPTPGEIATLEAAARANAGSTPHTVRLARAYVAAKRPADARRVLEPETAKHPNDAQLSVLLGVAYEDLGMYGEARRLYAAYIDHGSSRRLRSDLAKRMPLLQRRELEARIKTIVARESELANTPPTPFTVAVFPFEFVGTDSQYKPLGRAMAEFMVRDLSQTNRIKVLERSQVQLLLDELKLTQSGRVDPVTAARTGRMLGAERVVHGSLDGNIISLQLDGAIVRVGGNAWPGENSGDVISERDNLYALIAMQKRLALRIYTSLGVQLTEAERGRVTRRPTENVNAMLAYGRGLQAQDAGDFSTAARLFTESVRLDPGFSAARDAAAAATDATTAQTTGTGELAASSAASSAGGAATAEPDFFLPSPITRDAAAEILRTEGATRSTILEIVIRRQ